ncbi:uncharacterized protein AB675_3778 [Cyphellophora attinorum]|uniref:C2H2-type domain-containing protein n=1 Tax=Cyphellophora attinorum TaxID=1664694 RepID=A0A0N1GXT9_9EURO|nr:uncharacterized protein AB675_3778 [Phialophora attinorum]KPI35293.1 hypothetical protein AB675_3778 [Phialophora attinorum]
MSTTPPTYRLRQIPAYVERFSLVPFLRQTSASFDLVGEITVYSLAPSVGDWTRPPSQTATISFHANPELLWGQGNAWYFQLSDQQRPLEMDSHFLDFTVLNSVSEADHVVDCIAISGLASHPFGSWRYRQPRAGAQGASLNFMWLRDSLPWDVKGIRVLIYGYDSRLTHSHSFQTIDDIARGFVPMLRTIAPADQLKPIIILAHSLGGIVVKSALLRLAEMPEKEHILLRNIRSIMFFGVPSKGMHVGHFLSMVEGQYNQQLVKMLARGSMYLSDLDAKLSQVPCYRLMRLVSAHETETSPTTVVDANGKWTRDGSHEILVSPESATQPGCEPTDVFPINKDHSNMVKFAPGDADYARTLAYLRWLVNDTASQARDIYYGDRQTANDQDIFDASGAVYDWDAELQAVASDPWPLGSWAQQPSPVHEAARPDDQTRPHEDHNADHAILDAAEEVPEHSKGRNVDHAILDTPEESPQHSEAVASSFAGNDKMECPYCAIKFTHRDLKRHLLTHNQENPYVATRAAIPGRETTSVTDAARSLRQPTHSPAISDSRTDVPYGEPNSINSLSNDDVLEAGGVPTE